MTSTGAFEQADARPADRELEGGLERFLHTEARAKKAQVADIERLVAEVLKVLVWSFDGAREMRTWPYQLVSGEPYERSWKYSFSTAAMITFALGLATGRIQGSALAPTVGGRVSLGTEIESRINRQIARALDRAIEASAEVQSKADERAQGTGPLPRHEPALTESTTFGWDDPFTLTWLLDVLGGTKQVARAEFRNEKLKPRAWQRVRDVLAQPFEPSVSDAGREGNRSRALGVVLQINPDEVVPHAFPLLRFLQLGDTLSREDFAEPLSRTEDVSKAREYLFQRIHLQLSESQIPESDFDVGDLMFALEGWILTSAVEPDLALVGRAFDVLTEGQTRTPYWRPLRPFKVSKQGLVLLPQSVEIANSLLRICSSPKLVRARLFSRHVGLFDRYARWLLGQVFRGSLAGDNRQFVGWESEHTYTLDRIHLWQTSQVLIFLQHYAALLQQHIAQTSRELAGFFVPEGELPAEKKRLESWNKWRKSEPLASLAGQSVYKVYRQIHNDFVRPRTTGRTGNPAFSMLLYGPPGTGKSTIARELASALGFRMITITPSDFIALGREAVEARAKAIFQMLEEQNDLVVLFDEIDQLLLDRDSKLYGAQSDFFKLLTPGMLTKLNDLAKGRRVIFVLATNYYERIDRAIKRPGRIDGRFLVLPPDSDRRGRHFNEKQSKVWGELSRDTRKTVVAKTVRYTYRELDDLADDVRKRKAGSVSWDDAALAAIKAFRPIITIESYWPRLGLKESSKGQVLKGEADTVERPYEELALVAYLERETRGDLPKEPRWLGGALELAHKEEVLRDTEIERALWGS